MGILFFSVLNLSCHSDVSGLKGGMNTESLKLKVAVAKETIRNGLSHSTHIVSWGGREYLLEKEIKIELKTVGFQEIKRGRFWGSFRPTEKGGMDLEEFTEKHVGEEIAFLAGFKVLFVGKLYSKLQGQISLPAYNDAGWSFSEKEEIARHFKEK